MGLIATIDIQSDWGCESTTPILGIHVDYGPAADVFIDTFLSISREYVPVDTGYLQSTLNAYRDGSLLIAEATAEYAEYVEYGTWKMEAQPYFFIAIEEATAAAYPVARQLYIEALQQEAIEQAEDLQYESLVTQVSNAWGIFDIIIAIIIQAIVRSIIETIKKFLSGD